jgi:predicted Rossmann fold nucleotide-binding protein DprA/Smf involved in DNA uptake
MSLEGTVIDSTHPDYPVALRDKKGHTLFPRVWTVGNVKLLERRLIGFFCSVKCPGDLILKTYDLARSLRDNGVTVIGGFHSPIERDCLDLLIKGTQSIVLCPARSIENMLVKKMFRQPLDEGRLLFLSPFERKVKRPTTKTSQLRNQFVCTMAKAVFVSHAEAGGKIEEMSKEILSLNKPLYTFESAYNKTLIEMGAQPVKGENLNAWTTALNVEPLFANKP